MPCIILLLQTQHSRLFDAAEALSLAAGSARDTWPGDLYAFRKMLVRHDRMERDVFQRLGGRPGDDLLQVFDRILESQSGQDAAAVAEAARRIARLIEDHAETQESGLFLELIERHGDAFRHQLGDHYARLTADRLEFGDSATVAA
jgi:hypothetical protein